MREVSRSLLETVICSRSVQVTIFSADRHAIFENDRKIFKHNLKIIKKY